MKTTTTRLRTDEWMWTRHGAGLVRALALQTCVTAHTRARTHATGICALVQDRSLVPVTMPHATETKIAIAHRHVSVLTQGHVLGRADIALEIAGDTITMIVDRANREATTTTTTATDGAENGVGTVTVAVKTGTSSVMTTETTADGTTMRMIAETGKTATEITAGTAVGADRGGGVSAGGALGARELSPDRAHVPLCIGSEALTLRIRARVADVRSLWKSPLAPVHARLLLGPRRGPVRARARPRLSCNKRFRSSVPRRQRVTTMGL